MLDLFSGLGGASAAMVERGWEVITVDIEPRFSPTVVADLKDWSWHGAQPDLVWASPPCVEFSRLDKPWYRGPRKAPDMSLVLAAKRIINEVEPRFWIIENVRGAVKWFYPILGRPSWIDNPIYLWGKFPFLGNLQIAPWKEQLGCSRDRSALRAKMPIKLSKAIALAIESQEGML